MNRFMFILLSFIILNYKVDAKTMQGDIISPALELVLSQQMEDNPQTKFFSLLFVTYNHTRLLYILDSNNYYSDDEMLKMYSDGYFRINGRCFICCFLNNREEGYGDIVPKISDIDVSILNEIEPLYTCSGRVDYFKAYVIFSSDDIQEVNEDYISTSFPSLQDKSVITNPVFQNVFNNFIDRLNFLFDICFRKIDSKLYVVFRSGQFYYPNNLAAYFKLGDRYVCIYGSDKNILSRFFNPVFIYRATSEINDLKPLYVDDYGEGVGFSKAYRIESDSVLVPVEWDNPHYYELFR